MRCNKCGSIAALNKDALCDNCAKKIRESKKIIHSWF